MHANLIGNDRNYNGKSVKKRNLLNNVMNSIKANGK